MADRFRELLLAAVHLLGGQPTRTTELLGIRFVNTPNGGRRNVFIQHQIVYITTGYHKGYTQGGQLKVVQRYLPREVGEQLVWYLWLVLPFCQHIQVLGRGQAVTAAAGEASPYLWASDVVTTAADSTAEAAEGTKAGGATGGGATLVWSSDKMRRVVEDCAVRQLGTRLNISSWRHIAIAIARKYLRGLLGGSLGDSPAVAGFGAGSGAAAAAVFDDSDTEGDGDGEGLDNPWDLQAGHSSYTADMVYGREVQQGRDMLATRQDQFRQVSVAWHRFLGFGPARAAAKGLPEAFAAEGQVLRAKRLARLRRVDLAGQLRQLLQDPGAAFRGN
jgi:hypothetical protein